MNGSMPPWLLDWFAAPCTSAEGLRRFDALDAVAPARLFGRWRGRSCPTGHPFDGLLERLGWYGKAFEPPDRAHPLLFGNDRESLVALDPTWLPVRVPLQWPTLAHSATAGAAFKALRPLLATERPAATLRRVTYRGVASTAMVYARKPITDHFRAIATDQLLGVMETAGRPPFFFALVRA